MKKLLILVFSFLSLTSVKAAAGLQPGSNALKQSKDTTFANSASQMPLTPYGYQIKHRLDSIRKDIPLDYNEFVQSYIDSYLQNKDEMAHVIGLAKYYFPIYEKAFRDAGVPTEIKYLSIVESKLDPNAVSRVGATGPWQFMGATAKLYGLNMDDYIDERKDPVRASYAAAAYLKDAYEEFGDWLLAIASYNCGKSSIESAIEKSGGATDFWSIRQYLPVETRNYVPAYIAVAYVMNYYNKHNIIPERCEFGMKMDTIMVDKHISLSNICTTLNMDIKLLYGLNPVYRTYIVNGTPAAPRKVIIPQVPSNKYAALYDALNNPAPGFGVIRTEYHNSSRASSIKKHNYYITYKVKHGDTLKRIASRFDGISVKQIEEQNGLASAAQLQPGMTLKISKG